MHLTRLPYFYRGYAELLINRLGAEADSGLLGSQKVIFLALATKYDAPGELGQPLTRLLIAIET